MQHHAAIPENFFLSVQYVACYKVSSCMVGTIKGTDTPGSRTAIHTLTHLDHSCHGKITICRAILPGGASNQYLRTYPTTNTEKKIVVAEGMAPLIYDINNTRRSVEHGTRVQTALG